MPPAAPLPIRQVALLIDTSTHWSRQILVGIHNHMRVERSWQVVVEPHGSSDVILPPPGWKGDGIIADIRSPEIEERLLRLRIPVVNVSHVQLRRRFPRVCTDIDATCLLARDYFMNRAFRHFGYVDFQDIADDRRTFRIFESLVREAGCSCSEYTVSSRGWGSADWTLDIRKLGEWLRALPKPAAIFSWGVGREIIHACRLSGLRIPDEVSLLLQGYDDIFCEVCHIPMSGIIHSWQEIGLEAARLLDRLMQGAGGGRTERRIAPLGVNTRQSTETLAVADPALAGAIRHIQDNAGLPLQVEQVARHVGISRRDLERRFAKVLDQSPAEYIRTAHLEKAKSLLRLTTISIPDVARASGFGSPEYMAAAFKQRVGLSPLKYRLRYLARG